MNQRSAVSKINSKGILLVFPINNRKEPRSLWSEFFPRSKMKWEWNEDGDNRVGDLWMLMKRLSDSRQVVYSKWFQGRATFFSRDLFVALLTVSRDGNTVGLSRTSQELLEVLENDSPLSTKELKKLTDLRGRDMEPRYTRAMKDLFARFLVVAFGEVDDGAFPSLAVGATKNLFEDLWTQKMPQGDAWALIDKHMPEGTAVRKYLDKQLTLLNLERHSAQVEDSVDAN